MAKVIHYFVNCIVACSVLILGSCRVLKEPTIMRSAPMVGYKYVCIAPTKTISSKSEGTFIPMPYGGGTYIPSSSSEVIPSDVISGEMIKKGYVVHTSIQEDLKKETLIVNYGESNFHNKGIGYIIEVSIQFISAETNEIICTCTAEGRDGSSPALAIRNAIHRALSQL